MRLMIVEDDPLMLQRLSLVLADEKDIRIAGAFGTAREALKALKKCRPEVALIDIGLPDMSGIELIRKIKEAMPDVEIIAHTIFEDKDIVFSAIKAGASGYILKGERITDLIHRIQEVTSGGAPLSPKIARKVVREFQNESRSKEGLLTCREAQILTEIESGMSYKQIGTKFSISTHTVNAHIKNIYKKLQAKDRREALYSARKKGIL